jgi:hypothetical protein
MQLHLIENNKNNYNQLHKNMYSEYTVHIQNNTRKLTSQYQILIETVAGEILLRANRLCSKCTTDMIGDEFHYWFICQV